MMDITRQINTPRSFEDVMMSAITKRLLPQRIAQTERCGTAPEHPWIVDTIKAIDTPYFETAICTSCFGHGRWITVEEYDTQFEAECGHIKWCALMQPGDLPALQDIHADVIYLAE